MKTLRIGVIGAGGIATDAHIPGYLAQEGVEIVAICDVVPGKAQAVADKLGIPHAYESHTEMLNAEKLDAVSVCTPNFAHKQSTIDALEAGCNVLCEKPIAMNLAEGQAMVAAAEKAGKLLQIGLQQRFGAEAQLLKRFIEAGDLGEIYYGEGTYLRRRGIPGWGVFTHKNLQGGGAMIDIGVHALDLTLWLMGNPRPVSVMGATYAAFGNRPEVSSGKWAHWDASTFDVDDTGLAMIRFDNDATLILRATWASNIEASFGETRILGTGGGAKMSPLQIYSEAHGALVDITPQELPEVRGHTQEIAHFCACLRGEAECLVKPWQVLDVQAILDAVYKSSATGHEVRLDS